MAICSITHPKSRAYISILSGLIKQLRDRGIMCNEIIPNEFPSFSLNSLTLHCLENKIPYMMTIKSHSTDWASGDDFLQAQSQPLVTASTSGSPASSLKSSTGSPLHSPSLGCLATLYQLDKTRLREIKRCDIPNMVEYLVKKKSGD